MRIVFMGTPDFAVPSLRALLDEGYEVVAAVTQPDRPSGRKMILTPCPVKLLAQERDVPVLQFERIRRQEGLDALRQLDADLFVTAAFGQILSQKVLDIPRMGTVNVHASLLPGYRGPAPINWCIINGEKRTGVTTMMTDAGIDTGDILLQRETAIGQEETAGELTERLAALGADLLTETLRRLQAGDCPRTPQDGSRVSRHPMLEKETGRIDWTRDAQAIGNLVRGVNPWPGAWTTMPDGQTLKIWKARALRGAGDTGVMMDEEPYGLYVGCGRDVLEILELQAAGSKRMKAADYVRGHPVTDGVQLGLEEA